MGNATYSISTFWEFTKWLLDTPGHTFLVITLALIEKVPKLFPEKTNIMLKKPSKSRKLLKKN